jgi:O-antigen ligase
MSTARLHGVGLEEPTGASRGVSGAPGQPGLALAAALGALVIYAAFAHGGVSPTVTERLQLAVAVIAAVAAGAWLWGGALVLRAPALVWTALALLVAFAAWSAITLLWSVAPDQTWAECNRVLTYALVLTLAIALGSSHARATDMVAGGLLIGSLVVTAYGLGQKLLPGLHIAGLLQLNQTSRLARLQEPFGYWNALALFVAFGVPVALALAVDQARGERARIAGATAVAPMLLTIVFTYSRGGVLALACGLAAFIALGGARQRSLVWLGLVLLASAPPVVLGLLSHSLTAAHVELGPRELAGLELAAVLAACMVLASIAARRLMARERHAPLSPADARRIARGLAGLLAVLIISGLVAITFSARGLGGTASHFWHSFTATKAVSVNDPGRLLSADSENRWVWWKEAARAIGQRPVQGWGAGSFAVVHLLFRQDSLSVQQPHSVPLQFIVETGVVGGLLALGAFGLLIFAAQRTVRGRRPGGDRLLAAALFGACVAYAVHSLYDWDWDIPGLTLPVLIALGVLGSIRPPNRPATPRPAGPLAARALALGLSLVCLAAFVWSVAVPRLAAAQAQRALVSAAAASPSTLRSALATANDASSLDPLSDAGLLAASTIEVHLRHDVQSRRDLVAAVERVPTDAQAWQRLAFEDLVLDDNHDAAIAARRALALDPRGAGAIELARRVGLSIVRRARQSSAS